jgi:AAA+ superfamily predicted ATPase
VSDYYQGNLQHLLSALHRLDFLIELKLIKFHRENKSTDTAEFRGLYVSLEEVWAALQSPTGLPEPHHKNDTEARTEQELRLRLAELNQEIRQKTTASLHEGILLSLPLLANIFELNAFEIDSLVICLAPELDLKYEKLYAFLQNDVTRKRPTVRLILDLLCKSFEEEVAARRQFCSQASLFRYQLLQFGDIAPDKAASLLSQPLKLDERIAQFVLGSSQIDSRITAFAKVLQPGIETHGSVQDEPWQKRWVSLAQEYLHKKLPADGKLVFLLQGECPVERKAAAESISRDIGLPLLLVDLEALCNASIPMEMAMRLALREGLLQPAVLYVEHGDRFLGDDEKSLYVRNLLFKTIEDLSWLTFLGSSSAWPPPEDCVREHTFIQIHFPSSNYNKRKQIWETWLGNGRTVVSPSELAGLTNKFRFNTGQIQKAFHTARNIAVARDGCDFKITSNDLHQACRMVSNQKLNQYAQKITPKFTWDDLILPADRKAQLAEILQWVKYHHIVFEEWGFERKSSLGKGLSLLFAGPSGTGKTMAAEIIASELGLDLYRIGLSTVVSKYIGETEKNLSRVFEEAATSNAILFFDEADALFGKRSEVKDAHDRYANIEINYLLMKMEEHEGIVILATNMQKNLDEAFLRRLHFAVEFPLPDEEYRMHIWRSIFPREAPQAANIDFHFLAKRLKLSGGNIKNIAINAAFLAAENSGTIDMKHVILASKREFQKLGKICVKSDFEQYYELVKTQEEVV